MPDGDGGGGGAGLVERGLHRGEQLARGGGLQGEDDVLGTEMARDAARGLRLVDGGAGKAERERLDRAARSARHRRRNRAAVDAARQERADRDVGEHVALDRGLHARAGRLDPLGLAERMIDAEARLPEGADGRPARRADAEEVTRIETADGREDRARALDVAEAEEVVDGPLVDRKVVARQRTQRADLGGEG